jgi:hypothetical protein
VSQRNELTPKQTLILANKLPETMENIFPAKNFYGPEEALIVAYHVSIGNRRLSRLLVSQDTVSLRQSCHAIKHYRLHVWGVDVGVSSTVVILADRSAAKTCRQFEQFNNGFLFHGAAPVVICGLGKPQFNPGMTRHKINEVGL